MKPTRTRRLALAAVTTLGLMAACGGGGGGGGGGTPPPPPPPPPPPASFTIGGTLTPAAALVLDSDTNDPNQAPRADNGDFATAQAITASSQVLGTVNEARSGPQGASFSAGDVEDGFRVTVAAGQVVELDFTADPDVNDVDLYVLQNVNGTWTIAGESIGTSRSECVRITQAGEYVIDVNAFKGASLYNLRVVGAEAGANCANATGAALAVPGELIVGVPADAPRAARAQAAASGAALRTLRGELAPGRQALVALDEGPARTAQAAPRGLRAGLSAESQRHLRTVQAAKTLRASGAFEHVLFNRVLSTQALVGSFPPNDTRYPQQRWHYEQIALPAAMATLAALSPQPTQRPIVAVVDTGIVANHPDLAPQLVAGYDFIRDSTSAGDGNGIDADPDDLRTRASQPSFHGSHVAGTIAAQTFDGAGAAGVAPMAQIMPMRALGEGGSGSFYDITQAIRYAAGLANDAGRLPARRADVVNLSLGASGVACDADSVAFFASVRAQGTVVVAASGNESNRPAGVRTAVGYPANCAGVIAVTATDPQRGIAPYANTGSAVALAAPGGDMRFSTTGTGQPDGVYSTLATFDASGARVPTFGLMQGTSMATPHAAGVIALMRWVHPAITPAEIDTLLAQGALTDEAGTAGRDADYGWGVINAAKAVQAALALRGGTAPPVAGSVEAQPSTLDFGPTTTTLDFTLRAVGSTPETVTSVTADDPAVAVAALSVDGSGLGSYRVTVNRAPLPVGVATPTVTVRTTARTLAVRLSVEKRAAPAPGGGDVGPVYVLVFDAGTKEVIRQQRVAAVNGRYTWSMSDITATAITVVAGTDLDNDSFICSRGEACGAYPVLGATVAPIALTGNRGDLDFVLAPVGAGNAAAAAGASGAQKRLPMPTPKSSGSTLKVPASAPNE